MRRWILGLALLAAVLSLLSVLATAQSALPEGDNTRPLELAALPREEPQAAPPPEPEAEPEPGPESAFEWWMVAVCLGVFLVGSGLVLWIFRPKRIGKYEKRYEERFGTRK